MIFFLAADPAGMLIVAALREYRPGVRNCLDLLEMLEGLVNVKISFRHELTRASCSSVNEAWRSVNPDCADRPIVPASVPVRPK